MLNLTRDNTQLLINEIWQLPTERVDECIVAKLPAPSTILPRLRKVPGPKLMTKWEKFAQEKGITKKNKEKKVYDETLDVSTKNYLNCVNFQSFILCYGLEMGAHLRLSSGRS